MTERKRNGNSGCVCVYSICERVCKWVSGCLREIEIAVESACVRIYINIRIHKSECVCENIGESK